MERKSSIKDVHKYIKQDYPELYKTLCSKLGENNPFAKFSIGAGNYVWSDNRCQWSRMIDASELKQSIIIDSLNQTKADVASIIGSKTAEVLFTTPDNSYIYYNDNNGEVKILVTGWGFKKPVRVVVGPETTTTSHKNPISISFSYDGDRLKNYEFGLRLAKQVKRLSTDSSGLYVFDNLKVGENYVVTDINSSKDFQLNITEGQSLYDFDVTKYSALNISAISDDQPINGERVEILYHGRRYDTTTDGNGHATIQLPLYEGESVTASMRDKNESTHISESGGNIEFVFKTEKPVEPDKKFVNIQVSVMKDSEMLPSQPVTIGYGGVTFEGITDSNGTFSKQLEEIPNEVCTVNTPGFESQSKLLNCNELNKFVFEKTTAKTPSKDVFNPFILVKRENGDVVDNYPIAVEYDENITDFFSNAEGIVALSDFEDGKTMKVIDKNNLENVADYTLDKEQKEYVFIIPEEEKEETKDIKVMFRDLKDNPVVCSNVIFRQEGKPELKTQLNADGDTFFKEGIFDVNYPMTVHIIGWSNSEQYPPIPFTLEEKEYEYLLQEKEPETKSTWWKIIIEILACLIAIASLWLLWPFFEGFCQGMFESIY
jgi:hypothetical protein